MIQEQENMEVQVTGLAISKELSIMLHCDLKVKSIIGVGSTFSLLIPKDFDEELNQNQQLITKFDKNRLKQECSLEKKRYLFYIQIILNNLKLLLI